MLPEHKTHCELSRGLGSICGLDAWQVQAWSCCRGLAVSSGKRFLQRGSVQRVAFKRVERRREASTFRRRRAQGRVRATLQLVRCSEQRLWKTSCAARGGRHRRRGEERRGARQELTRARSEQSRRWSRPEGPPNKRALSRLPALALISDWIRAVVERRGALRAQAFHEMTGAVSYPFPTLQNPSCTSLSNQVHYTLVPRCPERLLLLRRGRSLVQWLSVVAESCQRVAALDANEVPLELRVSDEGGHRASGWRMDGRTQGGGRGRGEGRKRVSICTHRVPPNPAPVRESNDVHLACSKLPTRQQGQGHPRS